MIIAIEGIDGAGKHTLVAALLHHLSATSIAFPRYEDSAAAQLAQAALRGQMGDMAESAYGMAAVFALDRHGVKGELDRAKGNLHETAILDRYSASNAAYTWARTREETAVRWVEELEFERLGLPRPDLQVLVPTSPEVAAERAARREVADDSRTRDRYERDFALQEATYAAYASLAERSWASPWLVTADPAVIIDAMSALR